jgi:hypothetical protein
VLYQCGDLILRIAVEAIHRNYHRQAVVCPNIVNVAIEIRATLDQRLDVLGTQFGQFHTARIFQRANGRDQHDG